MFDNSKIESCLYGLVGWEDHYDTNEIPPLPSGLKESRSGRSFMEFLPFQDQLDVIRMSIPAGRSLDDYLEWRTKASIKSAVNKLVLLKQKQMNTKTLLENNKLFDKIGFIKDTILKEGRFVGFEINLAKYEGLSLQINKIGLQFDSPQTNLTIYVFHSSQEDPVFTKEVTTGASKTFEWVDFDDFNMRYVNYDENTQHDAGGVYYIGYFEDDVNGQAINRRFDFYKTSNCDSCGGKSEQYVNARRDFFTAVPIEVKSSNLNGTDLWDIELNQYPSTFNWGLNLDVSSRCDLSDFFCNQEDIFTEVIGQKVALDVISDIKNSTRSNYPNAQIVKNFLLRYTDGDKSTYAKGLEAKVEKELYKLLDALDFEFSKLKSPCLPCKGKKGVKYGAL